MKIIRPDFLLTSNVPKEQKEEYNLEKTKEKKVARKNMDTISSTLSKLKSLAKSKVEEKEIESFDDLAGYDIDPDSSDEEQEVITTIPEENIHQYQNVTKRYGVSQKQGDRNLKNPNELGYSWLPPKDQSGDGKTDLNKKFNY